MSYLTHKELYICVDFQYMFWSRKVSKECVCDVQDSKVKLFTKKHAVKLGIWYANIPL